MALETIKSMIRTIPDFPKPGIQFRDITTLLLDSKGWELTVNELVASCAGKTIDKVCGIESRGFIVAAALADRLRCGMVLARKQGKLPGPVEKMEYDLEYGTDCLEIHKDAIAAGDRILVVDDLIATGGTAEATCRLVEKLGGKVVGCTFIVDLPELKGLEKLREYHPHALIEFAGH